MDVYAVAVFIVSSSMKQVFRAFALVHICKQMY